MILKYLSKIENLFAIKLFNAKETLIKIMFSKTHGSKGNELNGLYIVIDKNARENTKLSLRQFSVFELAEKFLDSYGVFCDSFYCCCDIA